MAWSLDSIVKREYSVLTPAEGTAAPDKLFIIITARDGTKETIGSTVLDWDDDNDTRADDIEAALADVVATFT